MKQYAIALAALALTFPATAQSLQRLFAGKANEYGLVYTLPVTSLDIYIEAELVEEHPGQFYNYAKRHLGITDAVRADSRSATVKSITVIPRGIPDPKEEWLTQFKPGSSVFMTLADNNIPLGINSDGLAESTDPAVPAPRDAEPSPLETPAARQAVTEDMARSASVSKKAELAAQRIFELRETRNEIISGQSDNPPADGQAMQLVLQNLEQQEAALTAMFAGTRSSRTVVEKVNFTPDSTDVDGVVIARLSSVDGIVDASNLAGAPITLSVKVVERGTLPLTEKGLVKAFPKGGVAYRIPGTAVVSINYAGQTILSHEVTLAQLGVVFGLNPALFTDRRAPYSLTFSPVTGAVLELEPMKGE